MSIYAKMLDLRTDPSMGEQLEVVFVAVMALQDEEHIREFVKEHSLMNSSYYKHDIQFALSFCDMGRKKVWKDALHGIMFIDDLYSRSETDLYRWQVYVDENEQALKEFNNHVNSEKGQHQNILSQGPHRRI